VQLNSVDIPVPNYYVQPDEVCAKELAPWAQREERLLGRDTFFCQIRGEPLQPVPTCQREFFGRLAQRLRRVGNITLDVAPINAISRLPDIEARPSVAPGELARVKYLLVTAGITGAGKLPAALAYGAVVLMPRSFARAYYEHLLVPYRHYVPLWEHGRNDDLADKLEWLAAEPHAAEGIAAAGRSFACTHLVSGSRAAYWTELLQRYANVVMDYIVDDALLAKRNSSVQLLAVTNTTLRCDSLAKGNMCHWHGAGAPFDAG
jgi:Glycosyl transferase family 90